MGEKFNPEYRRFATQAKKAGYSEVERKALARDSGRIVNEGGKRLRGDIGAGRLVSFFEFLGGNRSIEPDDIRTLADFLYAYRSNESKGKEARQIPDSQWRLINLGCGLLESAFYSGTLLDLPKAHGAALTHMVNVISKIAEEPKNVTNIHALDTEKAVNFVGAVSHYSDLELKHMAEESFALSTNEQSERLTRIQEMRDRFTLSKDRVLLNIASRGRAGVAYMIKASLIANDIASPTSHTEKKRLKREHRMMGGFIPGDIERREKGTPAYRYFGDDKRAYTKQHFVPIEMPFATWALRYLRQNTATRTN